MLLVVVVAPIDRHCANPEETLQRLQAAPASRALDDREAMSDLKPGSVALSVDPIWLSDETDGEAAFSVYKTNYPVGCEQPFLLVFRTDRIVTAHTSRVGRVPVGYSGFPAYSRIQPVTLLSRRATKYTPKCAITLGPL